MNPVEIGQLWKAKKAVNLDKLFPNDYAVILSTDDKFWELGQFWWSAEPKGAFLGWGGARKFNLTVDEINENFEFLLSLPELVAKQ